MAPRSTGPKIPADLFGNLPIVARTLGAGIELDHDGSRSKLTNDAYIKEMSFHSAASSGPFPVVLTYVVDGEEQVVHFFTSNNPYDPGSRNDPNNPDNRDDPNFPHSWTETIDGLDYWSWHWVGDERLRLSVGFISGIDDADGNTLYRLYSTSGARTRVDDLPSGTASYEGTMRGDTHLANDPSSGHEAISGSLSLTADFDRGSLAGRISDIQVRTDNPKAPGDWEGPGTRHLSDTTYFEIGDGRIVDGEFTASLTGMDSNANAAMNDTVRGYEGGVLGAFYGPGAAEVGGVLNATRDDRVMGGVFGGVRR